MAYYLLAAVAVIAVIYLGSRLTIVTQAHEVVIERLGGYFTTWSVGIHFLVPFFDRINKKVSMKEHVIDFTPQPVITKDNVTMQIDTVVFYQITDSKLFAYGVEQPMRAIENLTATTLRNIIGELELDESLTSRDLINTRMRIILDEATDPWGIKINRVEVKNIIPPKDIREAMEKQMRAERGRRQSILIAEGEKRAAILTAEGENESQILRAEARRQTSILEAQGQSEAIMTVQKANAAAIAMIKEAGADEAFLRLESYKAMAEVAKGQATTLIIPSDLQGMVGLTSSIAEVFKANKK